MNFDSSLDPLDNLKRHIQMATAAGAQEPTAMSLATIDSLGNPRVRTVLFKGLVRGGLSFYTNYHSPKAKNLSSHDQAAVVFFWEVLRRQVRVTGVVDRLSRAESQAYFATRPRLSQIGAWASEQSQVIATQQILEDKIKILEEKFAGQTIPCPEFWGGYRLLPSQIEFWLGKEGRLHERYQYSRKADDSSVEPLWQMQMLSP